MNTKPIATLLLWLASTSAMVAADGGANTAFDRGLLEEEVHHQLDAAIQNYHQAIADFVTNRQMLATAIFRVGECYRKQGKLNAARMQYRQILKDFPEQTELVKLSQQIVGNATNPPPVYVLSFGNSGPSATNNLKFPGGVTVDVSGNVYVSDTHNNRIQKFSARGVPLGQWGEGGTNAGCFDYPQGLTTDSAGNVYVADTHNHRIQKFTADGSFIAQWGRLGSRPGEFNAPYSVAVDSTGNAYVADAHNHRIQKFNAAGEFLLQFGEDGTGPGQFDMPKSVALDRTGNVYVADVGNKRIQRFTGEGAYLDEWGSFGKQPGQFDVPHDVAVDSLGNIYVADADGPSRNNRIQAFFNDGTLAALWGTVGSGAGQFNFAARVAVDSTGLNIYVCDASNNRIQLFTYGGQ